MPGGGRFDGTAGVIVALEAVRSMQERGIRLRHAVEVVDCLAEEVSEFGLSCIGSRAIAGALPEDFLTRRKADGETLAQAIGRMGGAPDEIASARREDLCARLELHIEQGRVLEATGLDLGIVTSVVGITRVEIVIEGRADHAGTTGMADRRDALVAAASVVLAVRALAEAGAAAGQGHFVATAGEIEVTPNAANVVPGTARLLVEVRAVTEAATDGFLADLAGAAEGCAQAYGARVASFRVLSRGRPVGFDPALVALLREVSAAQGLRTQDMASGAGHDAAFFARIAPAAMLFVPSLDGRSHCPDEWTEKHHLAQGAAVLFETVRHIDRTCSVA
ncbi:Zn-dependent hydrolase [Rhodobacter sp.]